MFSMLLTVAILAAPAPQLSAEPGADILRALRAAVTEVSRIEPMPKVTLLAAADAAIRETRGLAVSPIYPVGR